MTPAEQILAVLAERGAAVVVEGANLRVRPASVLDDDLRMRLRESKAELISELTGAQTDTEALNPPAVVSLARAAEILGATVVPEGQAPTEWTQHEWANRKRLPPGKKLVVRCSLCGESATDPTEGVVWFDDHACPAVRPCSHCNGKGKSQCPLCKEQEHCCVCQAKGQVPRRAVAPADDLPTKLAKKTDEELLTDAALLSGAKPDELHELDQWLVTRELVVRGILEDTVGSFTPDLQLDFGPDCNREHHTVGDSPGSISCIYCHKIQESRPTYGRHLAVCAKKPEESLGPFRTMTPGACPHCKGTGFATSDDCSECQLETCCCNCYGAGREIEIPF